MVKRYFYIGFLILTSSVFSQKPMPLKGKYFGTYKGQIPPYLFDSGKVLVNVDSSDIEIVILDSAIYLHVGKNHLKGKYQVISETKTHFLLDCRMEGRLAHERVVVYKKGKMISREGLYPQPSTMLFRARE